MIEQRKPNHAVGNLTSSLHSLTYTELTALATQVIVAQEGAIRDIENIPADEIYKMASAILDGSSYWNEITNS